MTDENSLSTENQLLYLFMGVAVLVNFSGLLIPIAGPDAAVYAVVAKTMVLHNNFVQLFYHGADWLDKPHFPFWITALSFKLFGFTTWAYKLPGILFLMMGARYTWLFTKTLYNRDIAIWSVLVLLTAQHIVLSNNDVHAEPYLTGLIIAAVYHFYNAYIRNNYWQLLWACLFTAGAVMTKGMFALVPIGGAIAGHLIITRQWRQLFSFKWLIAGVLIGIFILPELWCLNQQFDLHPEKVVFGHKGVSGIKFFFWDSQLGRFFNTGPIKGTGDPTFFVHPTLWAFLPWSLLLFAAVFQFIKKGVKQSNTKEWFCVSGGLLTFILFSASGFQLPHYLNIVYPFFAIITAQYLYYVTSKNTIVTIEVTQKVIISLMLLGLIALHYFFRPGVFSLYTAATLGMLLAMLIFYNFFIGLPGYQKITIRTVLCTFIVSLYLNLSFYPSLMKYQAGSEAASWINANNKHNLPVAELKDYNTAPFEFYNNKPVALITIDKSNLPLTPFLLYAKAAELPALKAKGLKTITLATFKRYLITRLNFKFINKETRDKELEEMSVVEVE
ncbi:ArnT family glycosyltransferase [Mucilaginibacter flavidus]|uniref:ArnT family glycosyltransferase n=1 Tax=Mucilaginibacter flavidus TaxID=2949309 RepID=UPI0020928CBC|nr:glycosyltransferase family 39 protein [Mucilaginibacter flavidus]MCO5945844.1 glycosyltransferase family 39 protein [Mucilaginibacter flavidus]